MDVAGGVGTDRPGPVAHQWPPLSRRHVLAAALAASASLLGGCGLRLDLPQPPPPAPTRKPAPDEALIVSFIQDLRGLRERGQRLRASERHRSDVEDALRVLAMQDTVLTGRLTNQGVPTTEIGPAPTVTASGAPSTARPTGGQSLSGFATALVELPAGRWDTLASSSLVNRDVLLSATSARLASALRLDRSVPVPPAEQGLHARLVEHTAPLVYGFEIVAAQSVGRARGTALHTVTQLERLLEELIDGLPGSALPGGWSLPYPVTTPQAAARLATDLLTRAIAATTTLAAARSSARDLAAVGAWSARVQALGPPHGIRLAAFPGTSGTGAT